MSVAPVSSQVSSAAALAVGGKPHALQNLPQSEQVAAVSGQFEAILLRQFLTESVGNIMGSGPAGNVYGYMLTDLLATKLSEGGGLGLSSILQQQLAPRAGLAAADEPKGSS